jgi:hypothetical protein
MDGERHILRVDFCHGARLRKPLDIDLRDGTIHDEEELGRDKRDR